MYIHIYMYVLIYIYTYKHIPQRCDIGKETLSNCTCIFSQVSPTFPAKRTKYRAMSRFLQKSPIHSRLVQKSPTFRHLIIKNSAKEPIFPHFVTQISTRCKNTWLCCRNLVQKLTKSRAHFQKSTQRDGVGQEIVMDLPQCVSK